MGISILIMMEKKSRPQEQSAPLLGHKDCILFLLIPKSMLSQGPTLLPGEHSRPAVDWDPASGDLWG